MDILLDSSGDIALDERGDIQLADSVRQKIRIRLRWFFGEWRWLPEAGVDYYGKILVKGVTDSAIKREIKSSLSDIEEIRSLAISVNRNHKTRKAKITIAAETDVETIQEEVDISIA